MMLMHALLFLPLNLSLVSPAILTFSKHSTLFDEAGLFEPSLLNLRLTPDTRLTFEQDRIIDGLSMSVQHHFDSILLLVNGNLFVAMDTGRYLMLRSEKGEPFIDQSAVVAHYWNPGTYTTTTEGDRLPPMFPSLPLESTGLQNTFMKESGIKENQESISSSRKGSSPPSQAVKKASILEMRFSLQSGTHSTQMLRKVEGSQIGPFITEEPKILLSTFYLIQQKRFQLPKPKETDVDIQESMRQMSLQTERHPHSKSHPPISRKRSLSTEFEQMREKLAETQKPVDFGDEQFNPLIPLACGFRLECPEPTTELMETPSPIVKARKERNKTSSSKVEISMSTVQIHLPKGEVSTSATQTLPQIGVSMSIVQIHLPKTEVDKNTAQISLPKTEVNKSATQTLPKTEVSTSTTQTSKVKKSEKDNCIIL